MPSRARLDEFIAAVVSGDHAGAIERYYTEDASMQENASAPRVAATSWWRTNAPRSSG
jgi:hypothetical protein